MAEQYTIRDKIVSWLVDEDHEVKTEAPPKNIPVEWIVKVTVKVPVRVNILIQQPSLKRDRIIVQLNVAVSPQHREKLMRMEPLERARIIHGLLESLAHLCPDCIIIAIPKILEPNAFTVSRVLYTEEISRSLLANTIRVLVNAFSIIVGRFNVDLGTVTTSTRDRGRTEPPSII